MSNSTNKQITQSNETPPILLYSFYRWNCSTYKALRKIDDPVIKNYYFHGKQGVENFVKHITRYNYKYVLGFADYRKNARRVRIEGEFINKYGKNTILKNGPKIYKPNLDLSTNCKIIDNQDRPVEYYVADTHTWSSCNRSAYLSMHTIKENKLQTKFAFVHIPRSIPIKQMEKLIRHWIEELKV
jgi:hypothetical protein